MAIFYVLIYISKPHAGCIPEIVQAREGDEKWRLMPGVTGARRSSDICGVYYIDKYRRAEEELRLAFGPWSGTPGSQPGAAT